MGPLNQFCPREISVQAPTASNYMHQKWVLKGSKEETGSHAKNGAEGDSQGHDSDLSPGKKEMDIQEVNQGVNLPQDGERSKEGDKEGEEASSGELNIEESLSGAPEVVMNEQDVDQAKTHSKKESNESARSIRGQERDFEFNREKYFSPFLALEEAPMELEVGDSREHCRLTGPEIRLARSLHKGADLGGEEKLRGRPSEKSRKEKETSEQIEMGMQRTLDAGRG